MADKRIDELTALASVETTDLLPVWDTSAGQTKNIPVGDVSHTKLADIGTNTHTQIDTFIGTKAQASGLASLNASSKVVQDPANATATPTASKIPIADINGKLDSWVTAEITADQAAALAGTSGTPSGTNKFVTSDDVTEAKTASKIARRDANGDILVATTPTSGDAATSRTYVLGVALTMPTVLLATRAINAADGSVNYAHGLGRTPSYVKITAILGDSNGINNTPIFSVGLSNGSTHKCVYQSSVSLNGISTINNLTGGSSATKVVYIDSGGSNDNTGSQLQTATASFDSTNVTLTWDYTDSQSETDQTNSIQLMIEVYG